MDRNRLRLGSILKHRDGRISMVMRSGGKFAAKLPEQVMHLSAGNLAHIERVYSHELKHRHIYGLDVVAVQYNDKPHEDWQEQHKQRVIKFLNGKTNWDWDEEVVRTITLAYIDEEGIRRIQEFDVHMKDAKANIENIAKAFGYPIRFEEEED